MFLGISLVDVQGLGGRRGELRVGNFTVMGGVVGDINKLTRFFDQDECINGLTAGGNAWRLNTRLIKRKSKNG